MVLSNGQDWRYLDSINTAFRFFYISYISRVILVLGLTACPLFRKWVWVHRVLRSLLVYISSFILPATLHKEPAIVV